MAAVRVRDVSFSKPFDTETSTAPGSSSGAIDRAVVRTAKEGVASTTIPQSRTQPASQVKWSFSGSGTPFSMGFSRFSRRTADSSCVYDHRVTSWPFSSKTIARAVPQPPLPITAIFMVSAPLPSCDEN